MKFINLSYVMILACMLVCVLQNHSNNNSGSVMLVSAEGSDCVLFNGMKRDVCEFQISEWGCEYEWVGPGCPISRKRGTPDGGCQEIGKLFL